MKDRWQRQTVGYRCHATCCLNKGDKGGDSGMGVEFDACGGEFKGDMIGIIF